MADVVCAMNRPKESQLAFWPAVGRNLKIFVHLWTLVVKPSIYFNFQCSAICAIEVFLRSYAKSDVAGTFFTIVCSGYTCSELSMALGAHHEGLGEPIWVGRMLRPYNTHN